MRNRRNYYRILHVQPEAPLEIIKSSYRTLMLKLNKHPDRGGDHDNAALINEAYRVLSDPVKRARYDLAFKLVVSSNRGASKARARKKARAEAQSDPGTPDKARAVPKGVCVFCVTPYPVGLRSEPEAECCVCHSPLYEARHLQRRGSSKRSVARIKHDDEMVFYNRWPQKNADRAKICDLSPHGLQFLSSKPLVENQIIKIDSESLHATARIASCFLQSDTAGRYHRIGAEFLTLRFNHSQGTFVSTQV